MPGLYGVLIDKAWGEISFAYTSGNQNLPLNAVQILWGKIRLNWASFPVFIYGPLPETLEISLFSVRVENTLVYHSVCQNTADFDLSQWPPKALESMLFSPPCLPHPAPEKAEKTRI